MASIKENIKQINLTRTTLLLLAYNELSKMKKYYTTKINSKKIIEAENFYGNSYNYIVKLKEENYIPNYLGINVIQNMNFKNNFSFKSPDLQNSNFIREIDFPVKSKTNNNLFNKSRIGIFDVDSNFQNDLRILENKNDISSRKNQHFRMKNLKINFEETLITKENYSHSGNINNLRKKNNITNFINNESEVSIEKNQKLFKINLVFSFDIKTKERIEKGYAYLQNLSKKLKILHEQKKLKLNFDEMARAISEYEFPNHFNNNDHEKDHLSFINSVNNDKSYSENVISMTSKKVNEKDFLRENNNFNQLAVDKIITSFSKNYDLKNEIGDQTIKLKKIQSLNKIDKNIKRYRNSINNFNNKLFEEKPSLIKLIECDNLLKKERNDLNLNISHSKNKIDPKISSKSLKKLSFEGRNISNSDSNENFDISNKENANYSKSICDILNENINGSNIMPASDSFKSSKVYSFKIQLQCIEENKSRSYISTQNENDYFDDTEIDSYNWEDQNRNFTEENFHTLNKKSLFDITSFEDLKSEETYLDRIKNFNFDNQNMSFNRCCLESEKSKSLSKKSTFKKSIESNLNNNIKFYPHYLDDLNFTESNLNLNLKKVSPKKKFKCEENLKNKIFNENKNKNNKLLINKKNNPNNHIIKVINEENKEKVSLLNKINFYDDEYFDDKNILYDINSKILYFNFNTEFENDMKNGMSDSHFKNPINLSDDDLNHSRVQNKINDNSNDSSFKNNMNSIKLKNEKAKIIDHILFDEKPETFDFKIKLFEC